MSFSRWRFWGFCCCGADAGPERRVALVVGNGTYEEAGTLTNPVNDATDVAARLRDLGFEVIEGNDLGKRDLERKIGEFSDALEGAGAGLFYYAGHGLQVDGRNFIVPVDAKLDVPAKLRLETVQIDDILDIMEQQTKTSLVFLDACRNNPFVKSLRKLATNRSAAPLAGLAQFDSTRGSFIAFSTAPGSVALDGAGRNSPFAAALIKHMGDPGQSINDLMIAVRRDVVAETHDAQRPWEQGSLLDRFEFVPGGEAVAAAAPATEAKPVAPKSSETQVATLERSVGDTKAIETFLRTDYLSPDTSAMREAVKRVYGDFRKTVRHRARPRCDHQDQDRLVRAVLLVVAGAGAGQPGDHAARRTARRCQLRDELRLPAEGQRRRPTSPAARMSSSSWS